MIVQRMRNAVLFIALGAVSGASAQTFDGYALYNLSNQTTSRLVNSAGQVAYTWNCPTTYSYAMALKPNGNIVRTAVNTGNQINTAAVSGLVQELNPQGQVVWSFTYSSADYVTHHDMCLMPNGNVLLLAYVRKTVAELQAMGYTGTSAKYPGRIIEIQPTGTTAQIVWQWEMADRFIQYADASKPNYMPIAEHPERMNINVTVSGGGGPGGGIDWFHENGIDYNAELDQIVFSARYLSEILVIDHSTTTAEAAGHTGGNGGRGGDFLFRWGKPANYGVTGTQRIPAAVHDVKWIKAGAPNAGWLMFVNNNGGGNSTTTIDAINPARDGYNYPWTPGTVWGPANYDWRHTCLAYASGQSAAERMPNGNTFVAISGQYMYEVNSSNQVVWQYNAGPQKAFRYLCSDPGIIALLGEDPCGLATDVNEEENSAAFGIYPNPTEGMLNLVGVDMSTMRHFVVYDGTGREVKRTAPGWTVDVGDLPNGVYQVAVEHSTGQRDVRRVVVQH
ncbi:MAG: aryl-sulfate sulfotransferase [Flavobacteriales bacterium]|nr:aryl-sulfate sulfotransferase [Flavobacteriales bacterium]